jgi:hypothetical protein
MDTTDPMDRLTILERAQLLHDATLRRHGEMLDRHDEHIALLRGLMEQQTRTQAALSTIAERLTQRQDQHEEIMRRLAQTLDAIRDMLDRGNGH